MSAKTKPTETLPALDEAFRLLLHTDAGPAESSSLAGPDGTFYTGGVVEGPLPRVSFTEAFPAAHGTEAEEEALYAEELPPLEGMAKTMRKAIDAAQATTSKTAPTQEEVTQAVERFTADVEGGVTACPARCTVIVLVEDARTLLTSHERQAARITELEKKLAAKKAECEALEKALRRTRRNFVLAVEGKPVRDMTETLAECDAALRAAGE